MHELYKFSVQLGPHAQPSNAELRAALVAARAENESRPFHDDSAMQTLWAMHEQRSTWLDTDELALKQEIDTFLGMGSPFGEIWVTNSQYRLCEQYGATVFGNLNPGGRGYVRAAWNDGTELRFHITTPLRELHRQLSALRNRGSLDDDLRDLLTEACL